MENCRINVEDNLLPVTLINYGLSDDNGNFCFGAWNEYSYGCEKKTNSMFQRAIYELIDDAECWCRPLSFFPATFWATWDINVDRIHAYWNDNELQAQVRLPFSHCLSRAEVRLLTLSGHPIVTYHFFDGRYDTRGFTLTDLERCVRKAYDLFIKTDISFPLEFPLD